MHDMLSAPSLAQGLADSGCMALWSAVYVRSLWQACSPRAEYFVLGLA